MNIQAKSINYHLTKACDMQCKFCFATFQDIKHSKFDTNRAFRIIDEVVKAGFEKITFAGGEPSLIKSLPEIIAHAKKLDLNTTVVSNGFRFANSDLLNRLVENLDWLALSIDSSNFKSNILSGRITRKDELLNTNDYKRLIDSAREKNVKIKINTVVSKYNLSDDLNSMLNFLEPDRWKIFQAMPVNGQNTLYQSKFTITHEEYQSFLWRHIKSIAKHKGVDEPENLMRGSYYMISPDGKLFDSTIGEHEYSRDIIKFGIKEALNDIQFNYDKFIERGGDYDW